MWSISLLGRIDDNVKVTLVQPVAPAVGFAPPDAEPGQRREKKKSSAGHHLYWQLVDKLKKRDAGAAFLPSFSSFPPESSWN